MSIISTDMAKAKLIHKDKIRYYRNSKFTELDIQFQKALETSSDTSVIVNKKQALRDAPADNAITAATTTDELKSQWNSSILGSNPYS